MLNKYQRNPVEFRRVVSIIRAGMTMAEVEDVLNHNIYAFAKSLNLPSIRNRRLLARQVHKHLKITNPQNPFVEKEDLPKVIVCDGCGGISERDGLRWEKLNRGEPLTWSIDRTGMPNNAIPFTDFEIQGWFDAWARLSGFKVVKELRVKGDCHINFARIDGPGRTMGFVLQPRSPIEEMAKSGDLAADMTIDNSERSYPLNRTRRFGKHEGGHVFGLQHDPDPAALMYWALTADSDLNPQQTDIGQFYRRYVDLRTAA